MTLINKEDFADDETIEDDCNKDYPRAAKMTPGLAHIFCRHGICKGFVSMTTAESPQIFTNILTRRLPKTVQAQRRVFLYDNSCNMHYVGAPKKYLISNFSQIGIAGKTM